jgi:hypothetical protein
VDDAAPRYRVLCDDERTIYLGVGPGLDIDLYIATPPALGKPWSSPTLVAELWTEIQFFRIANGKVVEHWVDVDIFSWFQQLGIIPQMG